MSKKNDYSDIYQQVKDLHDQYLKMLEHQITTVSQIIKALNELLQIRINEINAGSQEDTDSTTK